jgi:molybdopterin converting factor small subunit
MWLFGRKRADPIRVTLNVRAFLDGQMVRLRLDAQASEGDRLRDLLKQLSREGTVDASVARFVLKGTRGVTVLHNGQRLPMPEGANAPLADGDELSVLTPMAGG